MRKYKSNYLKPYIRRIKANDLKLSSKCLSDTTYIRLLFAKDLDYKYVLVQRGAGILEVGDSKEMLKKQILVVHSNKDFNKWANRIKKMAQKR